MDKAFDRAATHIGNKIAKFVTAADKLVNLLATEPQPGDAAASVHKTSVDAAYTAYDLARRDLTGEDVSSA